MRMSCNGCRILRKGCSEDCSMRPCLQWIKSPESQANATVFLAKFYGRAGLMNLINAGPQHLRPAIFRSLLYEACGRIVNPIYGSVGLLWSGSWQLCQVAVENVLKGQPITPITSEAAANGHGPPLKAYDIRHVSKDENSAASNDLNKAKTRYGFKRAAGSKQPKPGMNGSGGSGVVEDSAAACFEAKPYWTMSGHEFNRSASHDSSLSHQSEAAVHVDSDGKESDESMLSSETAEASILFRSELEASAHRRAAPVQENELALELTLGLESSSSSSRAPHVVPVKKRKVEYAGSSEGEGACKVELGLVLTADIGSNYKLKRS